MLHWAERLEAEAEAPARARGLILQAAFGEYLSADDRGGIALSQVEMVRPGDLGVEADGPTPTPSTPDGGGQQALVTERGNTSPAVRMRIADLIAEGMDSGDFGESGLGDETLEMVRDQFRKVAEDHRRRPTAGT